MPAVSTLPETSVQRRWKRLPGESGGDGDPYAGYDSFVRTQWMRWFKRAAGKHIMTKMLFILPLLLVELAFAEDQTYENGVYKLGQRTCSVDLLAEFEPSIDLNRIIWKAETPPPLEPHEAKRIAQSYLASPKFKIEIPKVGWEVDHINLVNIPKTAVWIYEVSFHRRHHGETDSDYLTVPVSMTGSVAAFRKLAPQEMFHVK